jgi:hypothetical protein
LSAKLLLADTGRGVGSVNEDCRKQQIRIAWNNVLLICLPVLLLSIVIISVMMRVILEYNFPFSRS